MFTVEMAVLLGSAVVGTLGICLLYGVEKKAAIWALLSSFLCCVAFELTLYLGGGLLIASMIGSGVVAAYSDIMAHYLKVPATELIIPGLIILVPGGKLYYTMLGAVSSDMDAFYCNGRDALLIAAGLAIGVIAVTAVSRPINARISELKMQRVRTENQNSDIT